MSEQMKIRRNLIKTNEQTLYDALRASIPQRVNKVRSKFNLQLLFSSEQSEKFNWFIKSELS